MPKLYFTPTSCGAANYIAATLGRVPLESEVVDLRTHMTKSGKNFYEINPKGNVPSLFFEDGTLLNENVSTLTWISDQAAASADLLKPEGMNKYLFANALGFLASELHKAFGPLFNPSISDANKKSQKEIAMQKLKYLNDTLLPGKTFLLGDKISAADCYCYIILTWAPYLEIDLSPFPTVQAYRDRVAAHPKVQQAHAEMNSKA